MTVRVAVDPHAAELGRYRYRFTRDRSAKVDTQARLVHDLAALTAAWTAEHDGAGDAPAGGGR